MEGTICDYVRSRSKMGLETFHGEIYGEFHRLLRILAGEQAIDQAAAIDVSGLGLDAEDILGIPSCSA